MNRGEKEGRGIVSSRDSSLLELANDESASFSESLLIIEKLARKHNLKISDIAELLDNREKYVSIPVGLFRTELCPLEALTRYLKDVLEYSFVKIARMLNRDETTIWTSYNNSVKKAAKVIIDYEFTDLDKSKLKIKQECLVIPVSCFSERRLSVLETLCVYLKDNFGLSFHQIAVLLNRDDRTIWTVINRARKKLE